MLRTERQGEEKLHFSEGFRKACRLTKCMVAALTLVQFVSVLNLCRFV